MDLGLLAGSAVLAYFAFGAGLFEPQHDHIKEAVAAQLRDPSSAEFREIIEGQNTACGQVNAKNSFGAYAGFRNFVYHRGSVLLEPEESAGFNTQQLSQFYEDQVRFFRLQRACEE